MSLNFYDDKCKTITNEIKFGICDGKNDQNAFLAFGEQPDWICTVINNSQVSVEFRAIDHCVIILRNDGNQERSCDAMLTYEDNIVFIELKDKAKNWMEDGIKQIRETLLFFTANHDLSIYRHKRAFVANRKHPHFHFLDAEKKRWFWDNYKIRMDVQAKIIIK